MTNQNKHVFFGDELIFDIETDSLNTFSAKMKFFGAYSYKYNKYFFFNYTEREQIIKLIEEHRVLINHNLQGYDLPVMKNLVNNYQIFEYKVQVDTLKISRTKLNLMRDVNGNKIRSNKFKLDLVHKKLFPNEESKGDLDYKILYKNLEEYTVDELALIEKYTLQDIKITKDIFEQFCEQFYHLKDLLPMQQQKNYKWIVKNMGSYAYAVICNKLGLEEKYGGFDDGDLEYQGADVIDPKVFELHDNVYCIDWESMYPHCFFQFNLFSPCIYGSCDGCKICNKQKYYFKKNDMFELEGEYCNFKLGVKEALLKELYKSRKEYKKVGDPREAALKLVINSIYGITAKPIFTHTYYPYRASDCCKIGRQLLHYGEYFFEKHGYIVAAGDTDSLYLKDIYNDEIKLRNNIKKFISILKKYIPFPSDTFNFAVEHKIRDAWFIKKKMYLYVKENGELIIKGLPIIKSDASKLAVKIFNEKIKNNIIENRQLKLPKSKITHWLAEELERDITIVASTFGISEEDYKSENSFQAQIKNKYGPGAITLIKNRRFGVGKAVKYCTVEEAKKYLKPHEIDLDSTYKVLEPFYYDDETRKLSDFI